MVDVKKVTASITKPYLYQGKNHPGQQSLTEYINFNPTNNPPSVPGAESSDTVYTIDPFAVFVQETSNVGTILKVKVPFTRFYKIKYVIYPIGGGLGVTSSNSFYLIKPHTVFSEQLKLKRVTSGIEYEMYPGIFKSDGSYTISKEYDGLGSYLSRGIATAATFEGIVELYAGDELRFQHTLSVYSEVYPLRVIFDTSTGYLEMTNDNTQMSSLYQNTASSGFYFEMSEITDL